MDVLPEGLPRTNFARDRGEKGEEEEGRKKKREKRGGRRRPFYRLRPWGSFDGQ